MSTDAHLPAAGGLAAEIRAAIEAMNRRTGYLGPSVHQIERWAAEAERLEASCLRKPANPLPKTTGPGRPSAAVAAGPCCHWPT